VIRSRAADKDDGTVQERWGRVGRQTIEDTGPLTRKRMETIDDETSGAAMDFMDRQVKAGKPFFCWMNTTRMHAFTHVRAEHRDQPGLTARTEYADGMVEHDAIVGELLKKLEELGVADNTIVLYTTDNGPHMNSWPDAAMTPFRSEKNTNWEGAYRVPCMIRWPGHIKAGSVSNDMVSGLDWMPTLMAAAGSADVKEKLLKGYKVGAKSYKLHLDGYNQLPYLTGQQPKSARNTFFYFNDDGDLVALRYENWKIVFMEQRSRRHAAGVGGAVHAAARSQALRSACGSLRARRHHVQLVLGLGPSQSVRFAGRQHGRGQVPGDLQGVSRPVSGRRHSPSIRRLRR
jgi:arylsulfatase